MTKTYRTLEILWLVFFAVCLLYGLYEAYMHGLTTHVKMLFGGASLALVLSFIRRRQRKMTERNENSL